MALGANNKLPLRIARVTLFWWVLLTIVEFGDNPLGVLSYLATEDFDWRTSLLVILASSATVAAVILVRRELARSRIQPTALLGIECSIGEVPTSFNALPRIRDPQKERLALPPALDMWMAQAKATWPAHHNLLLAVWDTYCAHKHYPASHRRGGHASRLLHEHCAAVAVKALELAPGFEYSGVYVKARRRKTFKVLDKKDPGYKLLPQDPLIAVIGMAHDIGKLLVYRVSAKGDIVANAEEAGNTSHDDDKGVVHDVLAPRLLSRMPEYWELPDHDREALSVALAHYHHPSDFPIDKYGLPVDDRAAALMGILVAADRAVGVEETGVSASQDQEVDDYDADQVWEALVSVLCEPGRINGTGDPEKDASVRIGQKHEGKIFIREHDLRNLVLKKLGETISSGPDRYKITCAILAALYDRGLLYAEHRSASFSPHLPMYSVGLYHGKTTKHITDFAPAIVMHSPPPTMAELGRLTYLADHVATAVIKAASFYHLPVPPSESWIQEKNAAAFGAPTGLSADFPTEDGATDQLTPPHESESGTARPGDRDAQRALADAMADIEEEAEEEALLQFVAEEEASGKSKKGGTSKPGRRPLGLAALDPTASADMSRVVMQALEAQQRRKKAAVEAGQRPTTQEAE